MKALGNYIGMVVVALIVLAAVAPVLIRLSHVLLPVIVVGAVAAIAVRLVFSTTRRW
jgi:hypothetical protein